MADSASLISAKALYNAGVEEEDLARKNLDALRAEAAIVNYIRSLEHFALELITEQDSVKRESVFGEVQSTLMSLELLQYWVIAHRRVEKNRVQHRRDEDLEVRIEALRDRGAIKRLTRKPKKEKKRRREIEHHENESEYLERLRGELQTAVLTTKPDVTWADVKGLHGAKQNLKEAFILPKMFPNLFVGARKPWKSVLMYGPPGTGKSYLAEAVATETNSTFISITSSSIVSKWHGECAKNIALLFELARNHKDAIIFIDEVDSLARRRGSASFEELGSSRQILAEILTSLDQMFEDEEGVRFLAATNVPWELDDAFLRRMERQIYVPLPDKEARCGILKHHVGDTPHELSEEDFKDIAGRTEQFSASDVEILVRDAIMQPIRRLVKAKFFRTADIAGTDEVRGDMLLPCAEGDWGASPGSIADLDPSKALVPNVCRRDFEFGLLRVKPSTEREIFSKYDSFRLKAKKARDNITNPPVPFNIWGLIGQVAGDNELIKWALVLLIFRIITRSWFA